LRLITILLILLTTAALSATRAPAKPSAELAALRASSQPPERSVVGTLEQVDAASANLVVKTATGQQTFTLQSDATIRQGSKTIKVSDLASHKGERVKVRYRDVSGIRRAEWIVVATPARHVKGKGA
jgi:hypothetical protein